MEDREEREDWKYMYINGKEAEERETNTHTANRSLTREEMVQVYLCKGITRSQNWKKF